MFEAFYSAPFTDECYQNFRAQQGLFVELKDFASYLENEILGNDKISIELSSIGELPISKQVRFKNLRKLPDCYTLVFFIFGNLNLKPKTLLNSVSYFLDT